MTDAFRATVRQQHAEAFSIHRDVAIGVEEALLKERVHKDELGLSLDMLLGQAYKAHLSVWLLSEHGHVEDAATIARRIMELAAQAVYIGMDDDQSTRTSRAGRFCAHLWRGLPESSRAGLPEQIRTWWAEIYAHHSAELPKESKGWGPSFREMFREMGREDSYDEDYSLLSGVAHGRPDELVLTYAAPNIRLRAHHHVSAILVYSSRYYLAVVEPWNKFFDLLPEEEFTRLATRATSWSG